MTTCTLHPPPDLEAPVRILDARAPDPALVPRINDAWESLRAANPRYHDGAMLVVESRSPLTVRRDTYRTLATAAIFDPTIRALGVQGVVIGRDRSEHEHTLFGRRSAETRIYGGLWENAPSGGMTAAPGRGALSLGDFIGALRGEGIEELGLDLADAEIKPIALLDDPRAFSIDLVLEVRPHRPIDPRAIPCSARDGGRWEYIDAAWVRWDQIGGWMRRDRAAFSPSTLVLANRYGWGATA